jgi:hypothetical protein
VILLVNVVSNDKGIWWHAPTNTHTTTLGFFYVRGVRLGAPNQISPCRAKATRTTNLKQLKSDLNNYEILLIWAF